MEKKPMYLLTYDHGGFVLWGHKVAPQLKEALEWLKKYPKFKIGLDYEAFTFDEFAETEPEIMKTIKEALETYKGRFGLGSTTYGQPLSLYISEESNARQLSYAVRTNLAHFGQTPPVYSISEFALHNQIPQLARLCGYDAAILRSHVMGYGFPRTFDSAWGNWVGKDGTSIPAVPTYDDEGMGYSCTTMDNWIFTRWPGESQYSPEDFEEKFRKYEPLLASRYDDLTLRKEGLPAHAEEKDHWHFVLLEELPGLYGEAKDELKTEDNDFRSRMPWGYCGNEIFNGCRAAEVSVASAERANALAVMLGGESAQSELETAWKNVLVAQHHDVTICGLLELSRRFIPASLAASNAANDRSFDLFAKRFAHKVDATMVAFNPNSFPIKEWIMTEAQPILLELPPLTAKQLPIGAPATIDPRFGWDGKVLTTPNYKIKLTGAGIAWIDDAETGRRIVDNGDGALLAAPIEDIDYVSSGKWNVTLLAQGAVAVQTGTIGGLDYRFEMRLMGENKRIDCKTSVTVNGEHVGRAGVTKGLPEAHTVNGELHEEKLRFVMHANLAESRRMVRDLPYAIADWSGAVLKPEEYWYEGALVLNDAPVSAEESFASTTYLQGVYWLALRDAENGIAVFNRGCMGSAIAGNCVQIPLVYANDYMCGTKMLNGTFENEFAILPVGNELSDVDLHKSALSYAYPPIVRYIPEGEGDLTEIAAAELATEDNVILTALYPEDGAILARFCNFSDADAAATFTPAVGKVTAEVDLLGKVRQPLADGKLAFHPWEVKTVRIEL
ncbi:MAG: hypothetical protein E7452_02570 [Ruminococcaceae bacterium]|nr:hypothetical protein [Oscillospiraceae bacterium]